MDEELIRELQRLYARAIERQYTVKKVQEELLNLGVHIESNTPVGIMDDIRRFISIQIRNNKEARKAAQG